jgi:hypothetical protein
MELKTMGQAVSSYFDKNNETYPTGNLIVLDLTNLTSDSRLQFEENGETIINNKVNLYEIDYQKIDTTSLKYGNKKDGENDIYVVSQKTGKVYYAKGYTVGSKTYFAITQELAKTLEYNADKTITSSNKAVIFEPNTTKWTNQNVTVNIKVPKNLNSIVVTVNGSNVSLLSSDEEYNIYLATLTQNGSVVVSYKENVSDEQTKEAKYEVTNIDKEAPVITVGTISLSYNNEENVLGHIKILTKTDGISGIKSIKYEGEKIQTDISDYFKLNGTESKDDVIVVNKGDFNVTVYVEDNAGNSSYLVIPIAN